MGRRLAAFFTEADKIGGVLGKLKLAGEMKMTSAQATSIEDVPALIKKFEKAMEVVRTESTRSASAPAEGEIAASVSADAGKLRKHIQSYLDLMTQRALILGDVDETVRRVDEVAAETLDIARVSVWFLDDKSTKITSRDLFERATCKHAAGVELLRKDYPPYFNALQGEGTIAAHDAHNDPRTSCFSAGYLKPLGINSMLDVPIWVDQRMIGVVCHEHVGPMRTWNSDEEKFAYLMSSFVAMACERSKLETRSF